MAENHATGADMRATATLGGLKDLFYRSRFNEVLQTLESMEASAPLAPEFVLLRANTFFELHRVRDSKEILASLQATGNEAHPECIYASARLHYFDNRLAEAKSMFQRLVDSDCTPSLRFKGLLGVANTLYTMREYDGIPEILQELLSFEPLENEDEKLSLLIFLGNYYFAAGDNYDLAKEYFRKAMSGAASRSWTYFVVRSLIGLATVCEKAGQAAELSWTLGILQAFVDNSQQLYMIHLVNKQFKQHFTLNAPLEFDTANSRIFVNNRWVAFHEKPLLFRFLLMLHENEMFVSKQQIATMLWPEERYKPRIHDPRIFDIAKRARSMIEAYDRQPVVLLSGRMGYKLASI
jgi:tetratricopeptide (TPR) repeat protein